MTKTGYLTPPSYIPNNSIFRCSLMTRCMHSMLVTQLPSMVYKQTIAALSIIYCSASSNDHLVLYYLRRDYCWRLVPVLILYKCSLTSIPDPVLFPSCSRPVPFLFPSCSRPVPVLFPSCSLPVPVLFSRPLEGDFVPLDNFSRQFWRCATTLEI